MEELTEVTRKRVRDLRDEDQQDDLQAAVSVLKATAPMLVTSSKVRSRNAANNLVVLCECLKLGMAAVIGIKEMLVAVVFVHRRL